MMIGMISFSALNTKIQYTFVVYAKIQQLNNSKGLIENDFKDDDYTDITNYIIQKILV